MEGMARRTTVVLQREDEEALRAASEAEGLSQSEIIRRGIAAVTAAYRRGHRPRVGWLQLSRRELAAIRRDRFGDRDA
jgi:hypothetical protein